MLAADHGGQCQSSRPLPAKGYDKRMSMSADLPDIAGYRILGELGRGGMATVYLAEQLSLQRQVALKVMRPGGQGDGDFERFLARFLREGRLLARLSRHENLCGVYDVGRAGSLAYMAMEYVAGGTLADRLHVGLAPELAWAVFRQVLEAMAVVHAVGIVHRDLKPGNVLMRGDTPILTDFGIARDVHLGPGHTTAHMIIGTPLYMAPEQIQAQPIDARADLYALGAMLHELLVGQPPFVADSAMAVCMLHLSADVPRLPAPYAGLQPLLEALLAKDREQRPRDVGGVETMIEALLLADPLLAQRLGAAGVPATAPAVGAPAAVIRETDVPAPSAHRPGWRNSVLVATLGVLLVAALSWWWLRPLPPQDPSAVAAETIIAAPAPVPAPGVLVIDARPWGRVLAVRSPDGRDWLPAGAEATPLLLELPAGDYRVEISDAGGEARRELAAAVSAGGTATLQADFGNAVSVDDYLRAAGYR